MKQRILFLFIVVSTPAALWAGPCPKTGACLEKITNCDLGGKVLESVSLKGDQECYDRCEANASCDGYTFVTGWNKCFLRQGDLKRREIRIGSGTITRTGEKQTWQWDEDNLGKDLRQVGKVATIDDCAKACLAEPSCKAFAYIDGYATCWLKSNSGRTVAKSFLCGIRKL